MGPARDSAPLEEGGGTGSNGQQRGGYPQAHARGVLTVLTGLVTTSVAAIAAVFGAVAGVGVRHAGLLDGGGSRPVGIECVFGLGAAEVC